jgi:hypothetical protein
MWEWLLISSPTFLSPGRSVRSEAGRKAVEAVRISKGDFARERAKAGDGLMRGAEKDLATVS